MRYLHTIKPFDFEVALDRLEERGPFAPIIDGTYKLVFNNKPTIHKYVAILARRLPHDYVDPQSFGRWQRKVSRWHGSLAVAFHESTIEQLADFLDFNPCKYSVRSCWWKSVK